MAGEKNSSNGIKGTRRRMEKNRWHFSLRIHDCREEVEESGGRSSPIEAASMSRCTYSKKERANWRES